MTRVMKTPILFLFLLVALFACTSEQSFSLTNTTNDLLVEQPVSIKRQYFELGKSDYVKLYNHSELIEFQFDDLDGDGIWDEISLLLTFQAGEKIDLSYQIIEEGSLPVFQKKTAVHLGYSPNRDNQFVPVMEHKRPADHVAQSVPFLYQYEGPGWESERVGFRAYFDSRNGKDIFGKAREVLCIDRVGVGENYHELREWGMDILKVGNSLGAGALAMLKADTLYRLTNTLSAKFQIIAQGPVRSIFQLSYEGWPVANVNYALTETITIWAGKRHYESAIAFSGTESDTLVAGLVNLKDLVAKPVKSGANQILYTHGKQSENKDYLGLAMIVPENGLHNFSQSPDQGDGIINTYTSLLKPMDGKYYFAFYAGWELEDPLFKSEESFVEELLKTTTSFNQLIKIN